MLDVLKIMRLRRQINIARRSGRSTLFSHVFRCSRGDEFLKAGIVSERIEHWIELSEAERVEIALPNYFGAREATIFSKRGSTQEPVR
jgi:hypothetical protein